MVERSDLLEELLPVYDVSDSVACRVSAPAAVAWEAVMETDMIEVGRRKPLVGLLGGLRGLPGIVWDAVHGEGTSAPQRFRLRDAAGLNPEDGGWLLLGERPGSQIALGLVGKFWRPVIEFAHVAPEEFTAFAAPGYAKTVYLVSARSLGEGESVLVATMRTATTDDRARRWFRRYWTLGVGSGAHVLASGLLDVARERAEAGAAG